jgi:signal transduction histidine kinase
MAQARLLLDNANACINNIFFLGIALENQPRVFNEFAQFNRNTLQGGGGSGLGLWICRNLATLHGGEMVISSSEYEYEYSYDLFCTLTSVIALPFGW